ncbi:hypothetical protein FOA43_004625 [Brettanomyces nanus]|uniref:DNA repair protein RAD50 n=1 Tax=Eeniella nana TaxID=13502 RepID=A0A875S8I0_EENNA|nr:uncharacterized protein FOA43_004625 [Brettanomyces nanus]QPG77218.1 hypothetical protein FOA43_004625 [Brettanomyces nanus]
MSSIYKLSISGIRSFSDESQETIQFGKPLTLIVGTNGSGKTTVIECLRYATSGELPPNTKNGSSFINDPSLHSANETKAQIKLAFQNVNKVSMILSKSLMASRNPKSHNISFKTRENQLMAIRNGERQTISSKVADIEPLIPQQLGVSKAVLIYVIFCHQDDNGWPISDSATLKKRFDEIFDSVKFIKVLEEMKAATKELNIQIKVLTNDVSHLENDKIRAKQKRAHLSSLTFQIQSLEDEMVQLKMLIDEDDAKLSDLYNTKQDYERTLSQLESLKQQQNSTKQHIDRIRTTSKILNEPREVLQDRLNDFTNFMAVKRQKVDHLQEEIHVRNVDIDSKRAQYDEAMFEHGKLEGIFDKYQSNRERLRMLFDKYDFIDITDLNGSVAKLNAQYKSEKSEMIERLDDYDFQLVTVKEEITKEEQHCHYIKTDISNLKDNEKDMQKRLSGLGDNTTKLESAKGYLIENEEKLDDKRKNNGISETLRQIEGCNTTIKRCEVEIDDIQRKMNIARKNEEIHSKYNVLVEMNLKCMRSKDTAVKKLKNLLSTENDPQAEFLIQVNNLATERKACQTKLEDLKMKRAQLNSNLSRSQELRFQASEELKRLEAGFYEISNKYMACYGEELKSDEFDDVLLEVENDYSNDFTTMKNHESYVTFNKRAIELAKAKNACLLCHREFQGQEQSQFFKLLGEQNKKLNDSEEASNLLKQKEEVLKMMRNASKDVAKVKSLKDDNMDKDVVRYGNELKEVSSVIETENESLGNIMDQQEKMKSWESDVMHIRHWNEETDERKRQIDRLNQELIDDGSSGEYKELEERYREYSEEMRKARSNLESYRAEKELKLTELNRIEASVSDLKLKIKSLELISMDKINIEKSVEETKKQIVSLESSLGESKARCKILQASYDKSKREMDGYKNEVKVKVGSLENQLNEKKEIRNEVVNIDNAIKEYENTYAYKLEECKKRIQVYKSSIAAIEPEISELESQREELEKQISDASGEERTITYNIELISLENELINIEEDIGKLDVKKAEAERETYVTQSRHLQEQQMEHRRQYATKVGEKTQIQKQTESIVQEMNRDYKDVDKKYGEQYAKLQTKLALVTDLGTCYKATDDGVMMFHQQKMMEINRIIDELWKTTYTGNDVESIMIKADPISAGKPRTGSIRSHKSYNYRVVMIKNGVELDMRGRCSAGQRVLASIIIRLALAECFGLNFGMIALDEPTTNLDEENVESLAKALNKIIEMRSVQRNFQLIVITHDEKFLRYMNAVSFTDHYYRIARNERLHSTISKVRITSL